MQKVQTKWITYGITMIIIALTFAMFLIIRQKEMGTPIQEGNLGYLRLDIILEIIRLAVVEISLVCSVQYFFNNREKKIYKTGFCLSLLLQAIVLFVLAWIYIIAEGCGGKFFLNTNSYFRGGYVYVPICLRILFVYGIVSCMDLILQKITRNRLADILKRHKAWNTLCNVVIIAGSVLAICYRLGDSIMKFIFLYVDGFLI